MKKYQFKKKKENLLGFKFLCFSTVLIVVSYYSANEYTLFTRDKSISNLILDEVSNAIASKYVETKETFFEKNKDTDSIYIKELNIFLNKFDELYLPKNIDPQTPATKKDAHQDMKKESPGQEDNISINERQKKFTMQHLVAAQRVEEKSMIPAIFMIGQAGHETGWGKSEIKYADGTPSYNLFGIKATGGWSGKTVDIITTEHLKGKNVKLVAKFRAYNSYEESFADYAKLISNSPRYSAAKQAAENFAMEIQKAGYATDPQYAKKLSKSILITTKINP